MLLLSFYNRIDPVLIERLLPKESGNYQSGVYAQAFRLFDAGNNISLLFGVLLLPIFAKMIKAKESVEQLVKLSFTLIITVAIVVFVASHFYNVELMKLLYNQHSGENLSEYLLRINQSAKVFSLLMGSFVAVSSTYIFGTLLTANGSLKQLNIIATAGVIINFGVNLILIPRFEAIGSAYASLSAQSITAIAQIFIVQYFFRFKVNYKYLSSLFIYIIFVIVLGYLSLQIPLYWIYNFIILICVSILFAFFLKLINIKFLIQLISKQ